ncbi:MAG: hypothetical protein WKF70_09740 [Chitinophagaceae bacterium]
MKSICLIAVLAFFSGPALAQDGSKKEVKRFLFHSHGISFQKFESFRQRLTGMPQLESPKNSIGTLAFGVFAERGRLISAYSFNGGSSLNGDPDKKSTTTSFIGLSADAGYDLLKNTQVSLYPYVGLGLDRFQLVFRKDLSSVPFDSVLLSPNVQTQTVKTVFANSSVVYRLGIGFFFTSKKNVRSSIGAQLGYSGNFKPTEWLINETQILQNPPADKLSRLAAQVVIRYQLQNKRPLQ